MEAPDLRCEGESTMERWEDRLLAAYVRGMARRDLALLPASLMECLLELPSG